MKYEDLVIKSNKIIEDIKIEINNLMIGISYKLEYRIKSEDHIYRKLEKNNLKNITDVEDIIGFRILVENEDLCHRVYSILADYYNPYKISNYFVNPKDTGFKAYILKLDKYDINTEIQIMTYDMKIITEETHFIHEQTKYNN